jgi:hypothetical protein
MHQNAVQNGADLRESLNGKQYDQPRTCFDAICILQHPASSANTEMLT